MFAPTAASAAPATDAADSANSASSSGHGNADGEKPSSAASTAAERPPPAKDDSRGGDPMSVDGGNGEGTTVVGSSAGGESDSGKEETNYRVEASEVEKAAAAEPARQAANRPSKQAETDASSVPSEAHASKKRPREEESKDKDGVSGAAAPAAPAPEAPAVSAPEQAGERKPPSGDEAPVGGGGGDERGGSAAGPEVPKPLADPEVHEVVSQDLATQEIKRVRREEREPGPPPQRPASPSRQAADKDKHKDKEVGDKVATGGSSRPMGAGGVERANGTAPAEQRAQGNGAQPADGEPKGQIEQDGQEGGGGDGRGAAGRSQAGAGTAAGEGKETLASSAAAARAAAAGAESSPGVDKEASVGREVKQHQQRQPNGVVVSPSPSTFTKSDTVRPSPSAAKLAPVSTAPAANTTTTATAKNAASPPPPPTSSPAGERVTPSSESGPKAASAGSEKKAGPAEGEGTGMGPQPMEEEEGAVEEDKGKGKGREVAEAAAATAAAAAAAAKASDSCPNHALPAARAFFDYETVSDFEMRMLPEFFTGRSPSKTPEMYMQSRNYIVRSYQRMLEADADSDGRAFLTGTECRRKLAGDACSILRIHDFLDRFGLINTRAAGKRPASLPVPPPSTRLWNPPPRPAAASPPSRRGGGAGAAAERGLGRGGGAARAGGGWGYVGGQREQQGGANDDDREWRRDELVLLMEAAVANPHQWDAVAHRVAGGRTPSGCMKRFLALAVEEVVGEDGKVSAPPAKAASAAGGSPADAESTAGAGSGASMSFGGGGKGAGAGEGGLQGLARQQQGRQQQQERPAHLGQAVPALVLASALVSTVHPEVLSAAMAAAAEAVDGVVHRSAVTASSKGSGRGGAGSSSSGDGGDVALVAEMKGGCRGAAEEPDVEMRDAEDVAGMAPGTAAVSNGEQRGTRTGAPKPGQHAPALPRAAHDSGGGDPAAGVVGLELSGAARAAVLSVAGLQARSLAEQAERRTEELLSDLLEARVQRLEAKLHCFDELDQVLETERQSLEHDRAELLLERARSMLSK